MGDGRVAFDLRDFYHREVRLCGADSLTRTLEQNAGILRRLLPGIESGPLVPSAVKKCSLDAAIQADHRID